MGKKIVAPALVVCSSTQMVTSKKADETNFEIYRYLTVDPNGERNIFGKDQPFLFSDDWKPYINIEAFPRCQSESYGAAVQSLIAYTESKQFKAIKDGRSETEILYIGEELIVLKNAYSICQDQQKLTQKSYPCILQIVDHWFEANKNSKVNNYFNHSQGIKKQLEQINGSFEQIVIKIKNMLKESQSSIWERIGASFTQLCIKIEDLTIYKNGTFAFSYKGFTRFDKAWNYDKKSSWFDDRIKELREILKVCSEMLHDEIFFTDKREYVNCCFEEAKDLFGDFCETMQEFEYEDNLGFKDSLDELKSDLVKLELDKKDFSDMGREFLDNASFLVCRCGGIIRIVYDGQQLGVNLEKIYPNLMELLKWVENHLYENIYSDTVWQNWKVPTSLIDGFNFVRYVLLELKETSQFDSFIKATYNEEELDGFGVEMNITIQPRSVINKNEHNKAAVYSLVGAGLGAYSNFIKYGKYFSILASAVMEVLDPSDDNRRSVSAGIVATAPSGKVSKAGQLAGHFYVIKGLSGAIGHANYKSTADYVGEIKVVLKVGTHDVTYTMCYDINGKEMGGEPNVDMRVREKSVAGRNPSNGSVYNAIVLDARKFENIITVNTTLVVDSEKVEKIRKEYSVDEGGINEK